MAHPVNLNDKSFKSTIDTSEKPVLVDFSATWCGPCRMLEPIVKELATDLEGKLVVGKVDVDESPAVAQQFGIMGVPTLILFKGGREVSRMVGLRSKQALMQGIQQHLS
jgi:thioredoxin 1